MSNEWITDRLPTISDVVFYGDYYVWIHTNSKQARRKVEREHYTQVKHGQPWQPIIPPEPYVKPVTENLTGGQR